MRIKYIVSNDKINGNFDFIELVILKNSISEKEKEILQKYSFIFEEIENAQMKIKTDNFFNCFVEIDGKNKGIYFHKTKYFYTYMKDLSYLREDPSKYKNLIISKDGIRVELII